LFKSHYYKLVLTIQSLIQLYSCLSLSLKNPARISIANNVHRSLRRHRKRLPACIRNVKEDNRQLIANRSLRRLGLLKGHRSSSIILKRPIEFESEHYNSPCECGQSTRRLFNLLGLLEGSLGRDLCTVRFFFPLITAVFILSYIIIAFIIDIAAHRISQLLFETFLIDSDSNIS
jgi:hypothetical protein